MCSQSYSAICVKLLKWQCFPAAPEDGSMAAKRPDVIRRRRDRFGGAKSSISFG
jgi:hypothetical protein